MPSIDISEEELRIKIQEALEKRDSTPDSDIMGRVAATEDILFYEKLLHNVGLSRLMEEENWSMAANSEA